MSGANNNRDAKRMRVLKEEGKSVVTGKDGNDNNSNDAKRRLVLKKGKYYRAYELIRNSLRVITILEGMMDLIKKSDTVGDDLQYLRGGMDLYKMMMECCLETFVNWCYGKGRYMEMKKFEMDEFFSTSSDGAKLNELFTFPIEGITHYDWNKNSDVREERV